MPSPKKPCPTCGQPMNAKSQQCRQCKPSYERTPESRAKMSAALSGKPKPWLRGQRRSEKTRAKMRAFWTAEQREKKRQQELARNPNSRYHGLSARAAKRIRDAAGQCERCGHDGSESRLDVHHRDGNKKNQSLANLAVLCHLCHMQEHAARGETGWDSYHRKRNSR